jgi:putative protein kinase ArgK-like GTPase of G3E family
MTQTSENRQGALQGVPGEAVLSRLAELATEFGAAHIASAAHSTAQRVSEGRFYVACVGQFKRGKSTLLNALIGHSVLPTAVVPVTAVPTIIRYGQHLAARVRFQSAAWTDVPIGAVEEYVSEEKNPENAKGVAGVEIFVPSSLLASGMCLVDTPGLGSVFAGNTAATRAFIPHIDAALVVIGTDPPLSGDELQLLETVSREVHDLVFVLNKADRSSAEERTAARDFARRVLQARMAQSSPAILEVSALERLEKRGPERDWGMLLRAFDDLVSHSSRSLVRLAADRGVRRAAVQLLLVINEERNALERPIEESEIRIGRLQKALRESETRMRDLAVLLNAEQQRLSAALADRAKVFLKYAQVLARAELAAQLPSLKRSRNGPAYRRSVNHLAQEIACAQLTPWLESEAEFANQVFHKTAKRFLELANDFLHRLEETDVPGLEKLPEDLGLEQGLSAGSHFHFHVIERVAAPASPFLYVSDLFLGATGLRGGIIREAREFLDQLLEVNCSRVQNDVDERVRQSRKNLESELKGVLREASSVATGALTRAQVAQAAGARAVEAAVARLDGIQREILELVQRS